MVSEMLWKRLSEEEKRKVEAKAKNIMLDFGRTLEKLPKMQEAFVDRDDFEREDNNEKSCDNNFRELMFENAPNKNNEFIIAERGKWVEK